MKLLITWLDRKCDLIPLRNYEFISVKITDIASDYNNIL